MIQDIYNVRTRESVELRVAGVGGLQLCITKYPIKVVKITF